MKKSIIVGCIFFVSIITGVSFCVKSVLAAESVIVKENLLQLKKTNSCRGCDLSGADLTRFELAGADLEGADLSRVKFYLANLAGANLKNANLSGAIFGGADLGEADLRGADLRGALLESAYLAGTLLDGEFSKAKPFEAEGVTEVEKEVYIDDQSKPKKSPEKREVSVSTRRDFEDPPPPIVANQVKKRVKNNVLVPGNTPIPHSPPAKKLNTFKTVEITDPVSSSTLPVAPETVQLAPPEVRKMPVVSPPKTVVKEEISPPVLETVMDGKKVVETNDSIETVTVMSEDLAAQKKKNDNLDRLLDDNKCYGCDLSGLDLSGHDFEDADLEKADLTGCNLEKADLEGANLKGAKLVKANLRRANLKEADLYKADLSGADLKGINLQDAALDSTIMDGVIW